MGGILAAGAVGRALEVIIHCQEGLDGVRLGVLIDVILFLCGALAVVVILRGEADILILHGIQLLDGKLHLLHLLVGEGDALFLLLFGLLFSLGLFGSGFRCLHSFLLFAGRLLGLFAHLSVLLGG